MSGAARDGLDLARLPEIRGLGDRECTLNWIGQARRHPGDATRHQVFVRFAATSANVRCDAWISLDRFSVLILGSRWRRGIMVGKPLGVRTFTICADQPTWHNVSIDEAEGRLSFGTRYPLAFDRPAAPVLQVSTPRKEILYLPLSELLRAHYFSVPRALPSIFGGQVLFESLASQALQAWHYPGTCWIDKAGGIASFERARFITDYEALCLARVLFSDDGDRNLKRLRNWVDTEFHVYPFRKHIEERSDLPQLGLPYTSAKWNVIAQRLRSSPRGEPRYLVLQILSFDADEPYRELVIQTRDDSSATGRSDEDDESRSFGKRLDPLLNEEIELQDELADGSLTPISLNDVLPVDLASRRRRPLRNPEENKQLSGQASGQPFRSPLVTSGSLRETGTRGKGNAPIRPGHSEEKWPSRSEVLRLLNDALHQAFEPHIKAHRNLGIDASISSLPSKSAAYSFEFRPADAEDTVTRARQFLVVQINIGQKYAYVFDAERLIASDAFPLAVLARRADHPFGDFSTEQIEFIAQIFDRERRANRSWIAAKELRDAFTVRAVRHPRQRETTPREMNAFIERVVSKILALIADVRVLA